MKVFRNNLLSIPKSDSEYKSNNQDKIQLVNCPLDELKCTKQISGINANYRLSEIFSIEKDYHRSLDSLKGAFYKTTELNEHSCHKCAELFRSTILDSIKNIHYELQKLTSGFWGKKHFQHSYKMACEVLKEIENHEINKTFLLNKPQVRIIRNQPVKKVI